MIIKNNINPKNIDLLIYDVDGTLVEFKTLYNLLRESFKIHGVNFKQDYYKEYVSSVVKALNCDEKDFSFDKLSKSFEENFIICRDYKVSGSDYLNTLLSLERKYTRLKVGVKDTLPYLSNNYDQVISTNWFEDSQRVKLDKYNLCRYFQKIYSCEGTYPKPNMKHFKMISEDYSLNHNECLVIGDSDADMGAYFHGYNTLLVDYKGDKKDLYCCSSAVVTEFSDIKKILRK